MNYLLYWLLAGSLGLNLLWMYHDKEHDLPSLLRGLGFGLLLGPLSVLFWLYVLVWDRK